MPAPLRTLGELVDDIAAAMADWPDPGNGQVRAVPDERTLRYYATLGLIDRPLSWRGRTALYGTRHQWQVLAVKRLQGAEWPLAAIQRHLLNADEAVLRAAVARPGAPPDEPVDADGAAAGGGGAGVPPPGAAPGADAVMPGPGPAGSGPVGSPPAPAAAMPAAEPLNESEARRGARPGATRRAQAVASAASARARDFWKAPVVPPVAMRAHIACGAGAELVLPIGIAADAGLEEALAPLRAWLAVRAAATAGRGPLPDAVAESVSDAVAESVSASTNPNPKRKNP